jgi:hypothetical protein
MAAPAYTKDLTDISLAETDTTGYIQINHAGGAGCIDRQVTSNNRGIGFENGADIAATVKEVLLSTAEFP